MLQSRLIGVGITASSLALLAGCAGVDGTDRGAIRENVIEPGITAIEQASELACSGDAATLRAAIEAYELLEGASPADEAALVATEYVREESDLWDIEDGQLVAVDPDCGSVATAAPDAIEIVTSTEPPQSAEEVYAEFTAEQIAAIGGEQCARELAEIFSAADRYSAEVVTEPTDLQQLVDAGYLDSAPTLWEITNDLLRPVDGSGCLSPD